MLYNHRLEGGVVEGGNLAQGDLAGLRSSNGTIRMGFSNPVGIWGYGLVNKPPFWPSLSISLSGVSTTLP